MTHSKTGIAFLLAAAVASATPAPVVAQSCTQVISDLQAKTTPFYNETRANGWNFLRDEAMSPMLDRAKSIVSGDPTVQAWQQVQAAREVVEAWAARVMWIGGYLARLKACIASNCNSQQFHDQEMARAELVDSVRKQLNDWVQSLGDVGITAAAERVNKASSLVTNTFSGAQGLSETAITGAVGCMNTYVQTAQAAQADAVNLGSSPAAATAPPSSSGPSIGKILGWTALIGGAVIGGAYAAMPVEETSYLSSPTPTTSTQTTSPPVTSTANFRYGNWNCAGGSQCTTVYGGNPTGSVGPFCTATACAEWSRQDGSRTCSTSALFTIRSFPPAGRACSDQ